MISEKKLPIIKTESKAYPVRVLQFGEGNFLRAFVDWIIDKMNKDLDFNAGVAVVQPIEKGMVDMLKVQQGLYTVNLKGIKSGEAVKEYFLVDCIRQI